MIGIAIYWETFIGVKESIYYEDLVKDTLKPLYCTNVLLIHEEGLNPTGIGDLYFTQEIHSSIHALMEAHLDHTFVFLEAERNIPEGINYTELKDFEHPAENVIYVTGKDSGSIPLDTLNLNNNHVVTIKTFNNYAMWAIIIAGIVLYDRYSKL